MKPQAILGIALLVVGVILFTIGISTSHSVADQVSSTFTGRLTQATTGYLLGGIVAALTGMLLTLFALRGKRA